MSVDLFTIGASGTKAYRAALATISENITNANTAGYSRRTVNLTESSASNSTSVLYKTSANFGGVEAGKILRASDAYLDSASRLTGNLLGSADMRLRWNNNIQIALNDTSLGVGQSLSSLFASINQLAANPKDTSQRSTVLYNINRVVTGFNQAAGELADVSDSIGQMATGEVTALNTAIAQLADANEGLRRVRPGSAAEAQLLDRRDDALETIAQKIDVSITFGDHGVGQVSYNGTAIVDPINPTTFAVTQNADGTLALTHEGNAVSAPASGTLGGLFQSATVTRERRDALDDLATQFATDINAWNANGKTIAGVAGGALVAITAGADTLTVSTTNIDDIAAASADGTANGNLLNIDSIRGNGSVEKGWMTLISAQANMVATTKAEQGTVAVRDEQAKMARGSVNGVDLDVEAADLLRFQQAYQASARIIQIARENIQTIIGLF